MLHKSKLLFWNVVFRFLAGMSAQEEILCTKPTDLGILLDSSDAATINWREVLNFANALVDFFNVGPAGRRVGVITYGADANVAMDFNSLQGSNLSSDNVKDLINDLKPTGGPRFIDKALKLANSRLFTHDARMRDGDDDILKIIILLTAGKQTTEQGSFTPLSEASKPLLDKGVGIYVVGVGSKENIDINELVQISGRKENVLTSEMFKDLVMLAEDLAKVICGMKIIEVSALTYFLAFCILYIA
ncbi:matrilin-3-like [Montipora foliosa]|uniref:matrilin-3-like n=1 Tax=Montipora foliosa TaxID=591990 RepID=UPI0035F13E4E